MVFLTQFPSNYIPDILNDFNKEHTSMLLVSTLFRRKTNNVYFYIIQGCRFELRWISQKSQ